MMPKYYDVECKSGHVGRDKFYRVHHYICAKDGREAAEKARYIPRVKHDYKDCILNVTEISCEAYETGRRENDNNYYFLAHNAQDMWRLCPDLEDTLETEPHSEKHKDFLKQKLSQRNRRKYVNRYLCPSASIV